MTKTAKTLTVTLSEDDDPQLVAEARCRELRPDDLAGEYVRPALPTDPDTEVQDRRRRGLEAPERLAPTYLQSSP